MSRRNRRSGICPEFFDDDLLNDPRIRDIVMEYYDMHFPYDVTEWARENNPDPNLKYRDGWSEQIVFVRDKLTSMLVGERFDYEKYVKVISTHMSKSVKLPVFMIDLPKIGLTLVLRNNFYDWKVSVMSEKAVANDFEGLFTSGEKALHCEGFPEEFIFGTILENNHKFTVEISDVYKVYTFCYLLKKQVS